MKNRFAALPTYAVPIANTDEQYPIHRIFCVGRNYADHAAEMGMEVDREAPIYFTKTPSATVLSGAIIPYAAGTQNLHYEMELAVYLGAPLFKANQAQAAEAVFGYSCALDMTRRDLQAKMRDKSYPWDIAKNFEQSAVFSSITQAQDFLPNDQQIALSVNGQKRQDAKLSAMIWSIPEILSDLSQLYHLNAGDVVLTGTPAGVGAVQVGDTVSGTIEGLDPITLAIDPAS